MSGIISIDRAIHDKRLFAAALGDLDTWMMWCAVLCAAFALPLTAEQQRLFAAVSGGRLPPSKPVRELWCVIGRRSGKSRMAALIAVYLALFIRHKVAPGERPMVLVIAGSVDQARTVFSYVSGFLRSSPTLRREVVDIKRQEIELKNGVIIAVHSNSFRTVRGRTLVATIFDEVAFWRDETSATPDLEMYRAVLPSLATTKGMLIGISTPYRKLGLLYQKWRDGFAQDNPDTLVIQGSTREFNRTIDETEIAAQRASDPSAAISEWDALFRTDVSSFLDDELIDRAVDLSRPLELPPQPNTLYRAFTDASGGVGRDSYTLAIAHEQDGLYILDLVRGTPPGQKFNPQQVTKEYAKLLRDYHVREIVGDHYGAGWVSSAWRETNVEFRKSPLPKSSIYLECVPLFTRSLAQLPDHARFIRELRLLERSTGRSGKDAVDHPRHETDDYANAALGALYLCFKAATVEPFIIPPASAINPEIVGDGYNHPGSPMRSSAREAWWPYATGGNGPPGGWTVGTPFPGDRKTW